MLMRDRWWGHGQSYANETLFSFSFFFLPPDDLSVPSTPFWAGRRGEKQPKIFLFLHVFSLVMDVAQHVSLSPCVVKMFFFCCGSNQLSFNLEHIVDGRGDLISQGVVVCLVPNNHGVPPLLARDSFLNRVTTQL